MMQEAEEEALLPTQPLLAFWSSSSPVTVLRRPRPRQHFSSGGERRRRRERGQVGRRSGLFHETGWILNSNPKVDSPLQTQIFF